MVVFFYPYINFGDYIRHYPKFYHYKLICHVKLYKHTFRGIPMEYRGLRNGWRDWKTSVARGFIYNKVYFRFSDLGGGGNGDDVI